MADFNTSDTSEDDLEIQSDNDAEISIENERLMSAQREDGNGWYPIIEFLEGKVSSPTVRLQRKSADFALINRILHRKVMSETGPTMAVVVPSKLRAMVLYHMHDTPTSAHQGRRRTEKRIRRKYYWKTLKEDVEKYVDSCIVCKTMKASTTKPKGLLKSLPIAEAPLDRIGIDKVGGIQNSSNGFHYIYVIVDYCSRFAFAECTTDATAENAFKVLRNFIHRFGMPKEILADNGSEFAGVFAASLPAGVKFTHSTPRHPRTNGMVERLNRSLSQNIRTLISDPKHRDWDSRLPAAVYSYNTAVHDVTGFTPFFLMFGRHNIEMGAMGETISDSFSKTDIDIKDAWQLAKLRCLKSQLRDKRRYDMKHRPFDFHVGDLVVVDISIMRKGQSHRFNPRRNGPFRVVKVFDNNTVELSGVKRGSAIVNIERCHVLKERPEYLNFDPSSDKLSETHVGIAVGMQDSSDTDIEMENDNVPEMSDDEAPMMSSSVMLPIEKEELEEDQQLLALKPLRRSSRVRRQPDRLTYSSMSVEFSDADFGILFDDHVEGHVIENAAGMEAENGDPLSTDSRTNLDGTDA